MSTDPVVLVARCPTHGLHGLRQQCYVCDGPVEQVPMLPLEEMREEWTVAMVRDAEPPVFAYQWTTKAVAESLREAVGRAGAGQGLRYMLARRYISKEILS